MNANRNFLLAAIAGGLECKTITPADLLRHVTLEVLATYLPVTVKAKLLSHSMKAEHMDATVVVDIVETRILVEHVPEQLLWQCIAEAAERSLSVVRSATPVEKSAPKVTKATSAPSTLFRGSTSDKVRQHVRRPNVSRRPARLANAQSDIEPGSEFDIDTEIGSAFRLPVPGTGDDSIVGAKSRSGDQLPEWSDEKTVTSDFANRRNR